jgi:hypothetical protein
LSTSCVRFDEEVVGESDTRRETEGTEETELVDFPDFRVPKLGDGLETGRLGEAADVVLVAGEARRSEL